MSFCIFIRNESISRRFDQEWLREHFFARGSRFLHLTRCKMKMLWGLLVVLLAATTLSAQPNAGEIIQRSVEANQRDWKAAPDYSYFERDRGASGTKTYHVFMLKGSPYNYLILKNGQELSPQQQAQERQKLEQAIQQRKNETPRQRQERIQKYEKGRARDHQMMDQLVDAFIFKLQGEEKLDGFDVYVLSARPRPDYHPPTMQTEALTGMQGKMWIDKKTYQWVKVEAQVVHPVSVEGFLARVEPGTRFELEKMPVGDDIWLPQHFAMKSRARILFFFTRREQDDETYFGYRKGNSIPDLGAPISGAHP